MQQEKRHPNKNLETLAMEAITFIRENTWLQRGFINCGWGNGYVLIPEGHPLHGEHYDKIDVDVNGGLTFSELVDDDMIENIG